MHFSKKQKYLVLIPVLLLAISGGVWLTRNAVENMLSYSSNETEPILAEEEAPVEPEEPSEDVIAKSLKFQPKDKLPLEVQEKLKLSGDEPEIPYYALDITPDDTIYPQWHTTIINAPAAWDISTGSADTTVAVIDTGYALAHEDLSDAWFINDGEQGQTQSGDTCWTGSPADKQTNDCDDDGNGLDDDWRGWDFSNDDNTPQAGEDSTGATHGTKVAGLVGARGNNSTGIASVNWNTKILPLQGMFDEGFGYSSDIAYAIVYAVDMGADVINLSLGSPSPDSIMRSAIRYATENNVIVVTSSGNCGDEQSSEQCSGYPSPGGMGYPARYPETIAVGATTNSDARASFSSWGDELDIMAPGSGSIRTPSWSSTNQTDLYSNSAYGTSFSSPIVAGYVASIIGQQPDISRDEVLAIMVGGADKPSGMGSQDRTNQYGYGRINMNAGFLAIAEFINAINKTVADDIPATEKPLITTNIGHSSGSAITNSREASTYCVTTPNTDCQLILNKRGGSSVNLGAKQTNAQGLAVWYWRRSDVAGAGTYDATVTSNLLTSEVEELIVN